MWPAICDGVMSSDHVQFKALFVGLDWPLVRTLPAWRSTDPADQNWMRLPIRATMPATLAIAEIDLGALTLEQRKAVAQVIAVPERLRAEQEMLADHIRSLEHLSNTLFASHNEGTDYLIHPDGQVGRGRARRPAQSHLRNHCTSEGTKLIWRVRVANPWNMGENRVTISHAYIRF